MNLIGNGMLALLRHPTEIDRLRADPGLVRSAVEELIRYDGPVHVTARIATDRHRARRPDDPGGRAAGVVAGCGQPRPGPVPGPRPAGCRPGAQPPPGLWRRPPLLPRRSPRPHREPGGLRPPSSAGSPTWNWRRRTLRTATISSSVASPTSRWPSRRDPAEAVGWGGHGRWTASRPSGGERGTGGVGNVRGVREKPLVHLVIPRWGGTGLHQTFGHRMPPMALLVLAAHARRAGWDAKVIDQNYEPIPDETPRPRLPHRVDDDGAPGLPDRRRLPPQGREGRPRRRPPQPPPDRGPPPRRRRRLRRGRHRLRHRPPRRGRQHPPAPLQGQLPVDGRRPHEPRVGRHHQVLPDHEVRPPQHPPDHERLPLQLRLLLRHPHQRPRLPPQPHRPGDRGDQGPQTHRATRGRVGLRLLPRRRPGRRPRLLRRAVRGHPQLRREGEVGRPGQHRPGPQPQAPRPRHPQRPAHDVRRLRGHRPRVASSSATRRTAPASTASSSPASTKPAPASRAGSSSDSTARGPTASRRRPPLSTTSASTWPTSRSSRPTRAPPPTPACSATSASPASTGSATTCTPASTSRPA